MEGFRSRIICGVNKFLGGEKVRKIIILMLLALSSVFMIAAVPAFQSGNQYLSPHRTQDKLPVIDKMGGKEFLKDKLAVNSDWSNLKLKVKFADFNDKKNFKDTQMSIISGKGEDIIQINPSESWSETTKLQDGNSLVWGAVTGSIKSDNMGDSEVTVGFVEIPQETKSIYSLVISNNEQHKLIFLSFGNLDPTPEITNIIASMK